MKTAKAMQLAKIVSRMRYSKGFHSTMSMQSFRIGFFRLRQKRTRGGRSGIGFPPLRTGRFGGAGAAAALAPPAAPLLACASPSVLNCGCGGVGCVG